MPTPEQLLLDLGHRPAFGAEDFLPAECNREAREWLARHPRWPAPALVIHGPEACGKTHLAHVWGERVGARRLDPAALPVPGEPFDRPVGIIDPAEPVADERALLQLYNTVKEQGRHLLLIARRPPAHWTLRLADLASRLRAAPAVAIGPPDDAVLGALLLKLFADRQLEVKADVIAYLVRHMERSFAAAHRLAGQLDTLSLVRRRAITVPLARQALARANQDQQD